MARHDIDILIVQLRDGRWATRAEAAQTLTEFPSPLARDDLVRCLNDPEDRVRYWAVRALDVLPGDDLARLLAGRLADPSAAVRMASARALRQRVDRGVLGALLEVLGDGHDDVVYWAVEATVAYGEYAIPQLIQCLGHPRWRRRESAAEALRRIGEPAVEPLIRSLERDDPDVSYWAIRTLGRLRAQTARARLREYLQSERRDLVLVAIEALAALGDRDSLSTIVSFLGHKDAEVRDQAVNALASYGDFAVKLLADLLDGSRRMVKFAASQALGASGDAALVPLMEKLREDSDELRYWAVRALERFESPVVVPLLVGLLGDDSADVQLAAAQALGHFDLAVELAPRILAHLAAEDWRVRRAVAATVGAQRNWPPEALRPYLQDPDEDVRFWTVRVLAGRRDPAAVPLLIEMFEDEAWPIRNAAAEAVAGLGPAAVPAVRAAMVQRAADSNQRYWLTRSLVGIQDPTLVPGLVNLLVDPDQGVRQNAFDALVGQGDRAAGELLHTLRVVTARPLREAISKVLVAMRPARLQDVLDLLDFTDPELTHWATYILGHVGEAAVPVLAERAESGSERVRHEAMRALGYIEHPRTIQICLEALEDEFPSVRRAGLETLGRFRVQEAVPRILPFLEADELGLQLAAIEALGRIRGEGVREALEAQLASGRWEVQRVAVVALGELGDPASAPALQAMLVGAHRDLWTFLLPTLARLGGAVGVEPLVALLGVATRDELPPLLRCLGALGGPALAPRLAPLLSHPAWEVREAAIEAYGALGEGADPEPMKALVKSADPLLRSRARVALRRILGGAAWDRLLQGQLRRTLEDPAEAAFEEATQRLVAKDREGAKKKLRQALRHTKKAEYHGLLGALCMETGDRDGARRHFRRAVALAPEDPVALVKLGVLLAMDGEAHKAASALEKVLALPDLAPPVAELARRTLARLGAEDGQPGARSLDSP